MLNKLPNPAQSLNAMFDAFDDILLVLDHNGKILDYKTGSGSQWKVPVPQTTPMQFHDLFPAEVRQKFENAIQQLHNGSKAVSFEYRLPMHAGDFWYESCLVPFASDQNIMFVRNITKHKQSSNTELTLAYDRTIESWSQALYLRHQETEDHTRRVTELTLRLARRMNIPESDLIHIKRGSILHDIGKVAIPDSILFKPGPLTEDEWVVMRRHPLIAVEILRPIPYFVSVLPIPRSHHERWDGSGYPDGLAGESIPLFARIFALADVYDALTSDRSYRPAWSKMEAVSYILKQSGRHFDPSIVPVFIGMVAD